MSNGIRRLVAVAISAAHPLVALAHHSFPEFYNTSRVAEVNGTVVAVQWENPHVSFSVESEAGERWEIESNSIRGLERANLSAAIIAVDANLTVAGFPARNGEKKMYSSNLLLPDGTEIVLRPGSERRWTAGDAD